MTPVASSTALFEADLRDLAAAVLWLAYQGKLAKPVPMTTMDAIVSSLKSTISDLRDAFWRPTPSVPLQRARQVVYEALQILELNALVQCRYVGSDSTSEQYFLTRKGRAALLDGTVREQLTHA
jgi:hypothetical protein